MSVYDTNEMNEYAKISLWVIGALEELVSLGLLSGSKNTTPKGKAAWDQLDKEYRPRNEDIETFLKIYLEDFDPLLTKLLIKFRDNRESMYKT